MGYLSFNYTIICTLTAGKRGILSLEDIQLRVDTFCNKVKEDLLIGPIFNDRIQDRWPYHLTKMVTFCQSILLGEPTYYGSPISPHGQRPIEKEHFERWIVLFSKTLDELFTGQIASETKWRANKMAGMFQYKINHYRNYRLESLI